MMYQNYSNGRTISYFNKNYNIDRRSSRIYNDFIENLELQMPISRESMYNNLSKEENFRFINQHFQEIRQKYIFKLRSNRTMEDIRLSTEHIFFNWYNLRDLVKNCEFEYVQKNDPNEPDFFEIKINDEIENTHTNNNIYNRDNFENESKINKEQNNKKDNDNEWNMVNEWNEEKGNKNENVKAISFTGWGENKEEKIIYTGDSYDEENKYQKLSDYGKVYVSKKLEERYESSNDMKNRKNDKRSHRRTSSSVQKLHVKRTQKFDNKYNIDMNLVRNLLPTKKEEQKKQPKTEEPNINNIKITEKNKPMESNTNKKEENKNQNNNTEEKNKNQYLERKREPSKEDIDKKKTNITEQKNNNQKESAKRMSKGNNNTNVNQIIIKPNETKKKKETEKIEEDKAPEIINITETSSSEEEEEKQSKKSGLKTTIKLSKRNIRKKLLDETNNINQYENNKVDKKEEPKQTEQKNNNNVENIQMNEKENQNMMIEKDEQKDKTKNIKQKEQQISIDQKNNNIVDNNKMNEKDKPIMMNQTDEHNLNPYNMNIIEKPKTMSEKDKPITINQTDEQNKKSNNTYIIEKPKTMNENNEECKKQNNTENKSNKKYEEKGTTNINENNKEKQTDKNIENTIKNTRAKKTNEIDDPNRNTNTKLRKDDENKQSKERNYTYQDYCYNTVDLVTLNYKKNKDNIIFYVGNKKNINRNFLKIDIPENVKEDQNTFLKMILILCGVNPIFHPILRKKIYDEFEKENPLTKVIYEYHIINDIKEILQKDKYIIPILAIPFGKKVGISIIYQYYENYEKYLEGIAKDDYIKILILKRKSDKNINNEYLYDYYVAYKEERIAPIELFAKLTNVLSDNSNLMDEE